MKLYFKSIIATLLFSPSFIFTEYLNEPKNLYEALEASDIESVKKIIQADKSLANKAIVGPEIKRFVYPLEIAVILDDRKMVKLLLEFNANPNQKDSDGNELIALATDSSIVKQLIRAGLDIYAISPNSYTEIDTTEIKMLQKAFEELDPRILKTKTNKLLLTNLYKGLTTAGDYSDRLYEVGRKAILAQNRDSFDSIMRKLYNNDDNSERKQAYNTVKRRLNNFEMSRNPKIGGIQTKFK